mmetsp:Transcript_61575/g.200951  ORF Transcript_61575/g.200951 Transcript_61575/m.200951 type:complete len:127 (+) Transcript_61575:87-467(+)
MADIEGSDVEVAKEDQQNINRFSRLNLKYEELDFELVQLKKDVQTYKDATEEVEGCMEEDGIRYRVGEAYMCMAEDRVTEKLAKLIEEADSKLTTKTDEIEEVKIEMDKLKKLLYSKFKNSINLER